jgi:hypothetical protein
MKKISNAAKLARAKYMREYRKRPGVREKEKARRVAYWEKKAAELKEQERQADHANGKESSHGEE